MNGRAFTKARGLQKKGVGTPPGACVCGCSWVSAVCVLRQQETRQGKRPCPSVCVYAAIPFTGSWEENPDTKTARHKRGVCRQQTRVCRQQTNTRPPPAAEAADMMTRHDRTHPIHSQEPRPVAGVWASGARQKEARVCAFRVRHDCWRKTRKAGRPEHSGNRSSDLKCKQQQLPCTLQSCVMGPQPPDGLQTSDVGPGTPSHTNMCGRQRQRGYVTTLLGGGCSTACVLSNAVLSAAISPK